MHRRSDDPAGQIAVGDGDADLAQGVPKAGHNAVRGVGEGAVEVEDHQLGAMRLSGGDSACHGTIVLDAATASGYRG